MAHVHPIDREAHGTIDALAALTLEAFREHAPGWIPDMGAARAEVLESFEPGRFSFYVTDDAGEPAGWVGVIPQGEAPVWEIHPIAVAAGSRGRGCGRRLVEHVERLASDAKIQTLFVGTSDMTGGTSLSGIDLYADPMGAMANVTVERPHPLGFWLRLGYTLVGVLPDREGPGMPDIHLAKRVRPST